MFLLTYRRWNAKKKIQNNYLFTNIFINIELSNSKKVKKWILRVFFKLLHEIRYLFALKEINQRNFKSYLLTSDVDWQKNSNSFKSVDWFMEHFKWS